MTDAAKPVDVKRVGQTGLAMHVRGDLGGGVVLLQSTHRLALSVRSEEGRAILYQDDGDGPVTELARFSSLETANNALAELTQQLGALHADAPAPAADADSPAFRQPMGQMALAGLAGMAVTLLITLAVGGQSRQAAPGNISVTLDMPEAVVTALANGSAGSGSDSGPQTAAADQATDMLNKYLAMEGDQEQTIENLSKLAERNPNLRFSEDGTALLPPEIRQKALANAGSELANTDDITALAESVRTGEDPESLKQSALSDDPDTSDLPPAPSDMIGQDMANSSNEEVLEMFTENMGKSMAGSASQGASAIVIEPKADPLVEDLRDIGLENKRRRAENKRRIQEQMQFQYMQALDIEQNKDKPTVSLDAMGME